MTKLLIVNADDFGLCKEISMGIIKAHSEGIVTATSVIVNGRYFKEGISILKDSGIDVGIHLTFTGGEKPVSGNIQGLVDSRGLFLKSYREVIPRIIMRRYDQKALEKELSEQISVLMDNHVPASHIDSHQHLHLLPGVRDIVIRLAHQFKIPWIRIPHSKGISMKSLGIDILSWVLKSKLKLQGIGVTDRFIGLEKGGHMDEARLSDLLKKIDNHGITELMVHPGYDASADYDWGYAWEDELKALTSGTIKELIRNMGITLTSFRRYDEG